LIRNFDIGELHDLGDDHADHAALDGIDRGQSEKDEGVNVFVSKESRGCAGKMPGQGLATQKIGIHVLRATPGNPQSNQDNCQEINDDDGEINGL
jgi:hypothetical protein